MKKNKQENTQIEHLNGAGAGGTSGLPGFGKLISGSSAQPNLGHGWSAPKSGETGRKMSTGR